jgi:hypothetical protein
MSTPVTCPILRPSGIFNQFASRRYGLGAPFGSAGACASSSALSPMLAAAMIPNRNVTVLARNMDTSLKMRLSVGASLLPHGDVIDKKTTSAFSSAPSMVRRFFTLAGL